MYSLEIIPSVKKTFDRLERKDKSQLCNISNKIGEILNDPYRFKSLRRPMNHLRRVHIAKSFVLIYSINEQKKTVTIMDYDHHNNVYRC
ncbi:MAG: type II toxin-antitoxin system mRNA interferase toxin, RelE/StbE family [Candidatus Aenigmatarchaeota archaeon]